MKLKFIENKIFVEEYKEKIRSFAVTLIRSHFKESLSRIYFCKKIL